MKMLEWKKKLFKKPAYLKMNQTFYKLKIYYLSKNKMDRFNIYIIKGELANRIRKIIQGSS